VSKHQVLHHKKPTQHPKTKYETNIVLSAFKETPTQQCPKTKFKTTKNVLNTYKKNSPKAKIFPNASSCSHLSRHIPKHKV
jgi:hypothetical protein